MSLITVSIGVDALEMLLTAAVCNLREHTPTSDGDLIQWCMAISQAQQAIAAAPKAQLIALVANEQPAPLAATPVIPQPAASDATVPPVVLPTVETAGVGNTPVVAPVVIAA